MINPDDYKRNYFRPDVTVYVQYNYKDDEIVSAELRMITVNADGKNPTEVRTDVPTSGGAWSGLKGVLKAAIQQIEQDTSWQVYEE
jgi:hypothetical protein